MLLLLGEDLGSASETVSSNLANLKLKILKISLELCSESYGVDMTSPVAWISHKVFSVRVPTRILQ